MPTALVTGAAGFIGSNLFKRLVNDGWEVRGVDDLSNGHMEFLSEGWRASVMPKDFTDPQVLGAIRAQLFDVVFHLAAVPRVSYSVEHPLETHETNVTKTLQLMDACRGNVGRLVFASSSSVYGGADDLPTFEDAPKRPKSPYALQKSIIEDYLQLYGQLYGLDSACLRFFNVFGPCALGDSPYATAVSAWLTAIKKGLPMRSDGDGTQSRDLCYVDNVTDACVRVARIPGPLGGRCYNVACGDRTTNRDILGYLTTRYPQATYVDAPWRPGDVMHTQAGIVRAEIELGYVPLVRAWEGIERTCDWYDANWEGWVKDMVLKA
jgi:nucleoside-diphosphate-sugar epimerase